MATVTDTISQIVQETLTPKIDLLMLKLSPFFQQVFRDSRNVKNDPNIGKDWKVLRTFCLGLAGATEWASMTGPDVLHNDNDGASGAPGYQVYGGVETWPGLTEATAPAYVRREVTLKRLKVTMYVPLTIIRAAMLGSSIGDQMEKTIDATAMRVAMDKCNAFFAKTISGGKNVLGQFTASSTNISSTGAQITLNSGSSIRRFASGMRVDLFTQGSGTRLNNDPVFVDVVDPFGTSGSPVTTGGGTIKLFHVGAATTSIASGTIDIVPRNSGRENGASSSNMPTPLEDILIDTGNVYGVSVDNYPILKSLVRDLGGLTLTESTLIKHCAHYYHARGDLFAFDHLWSTAGVWAGYFNNLDGYYQIERNGAVSNVKAGVADKVTFSLYGHTLSCAADPWIPTGTVYGLKMNDGNFSMVVPPRIRRTATSPVFDPGIEFLAPLFSNTGSIFQGYKKVGGADAGATTDFLEAPGEHPYEIMPEYIPGMKLTSAAEFYG